MTQEISESRAEYTTKCRTCNVVFTDPKTYELHMIRHALDDLDKILDWLTREVGDIAHAGIPTKARW